MIYSCALRMGARRARVRYLIQLFFAIFLQILLSHFGVPLEIFQIGRVLIFWELLAEQKTPQITGPCEGVLSF